MKNGLKEEQARRLSTHACTMSGSTLQGAEAMNACLKALYGSFVTFCYHFSKSSSSAAWSAVQITVHGLPIRPAFSRNLASKRQLRKRLGLDNKLPIVLLVGESLLHSRRVPSTLARMHSALRQSGIMMHTGRKHAALKLSGHLNVILSHLAGHTLTYSLAL